MNRRRFSICMLVVGLGLLAYAPGTSDLVPGLAAARPAISPDGLVYTFTLWNEPGWERWAPLAEPSVPIPDWSLRTPRCPDRARSRATLQQP